MTENPAAKEACLEGVFIWNTRNYEQYASAEQHFRRAISLDSSYAPAYAGLSDVLRFLGADPNVRAQRSAEAEVAARKALALDPNLAEAETALGLLAMNYHWDWPGISQGPCRGRQARADLPEYMELRNFRVHLWTSRGQGQSKDFLATALKRHTSVDDYLCFV